MDGGPHQEIAPGQTWVGEFPVIQAASMNWFHPHKEGITGRHVLMGLAGLMLVEDETSDGLDLPRDWGRDDIPVILQDRRFNPDGSFDYALGNHEAMRGFLGDTYLINGTVDAGVAVPPGEIRLRLLNGSNAREYDLAFDDGRAFHLIAGDGGFLERPLTMNRLLMTPGERAEILVDLSDRPGGMLNLINRADRDARLLLLDVASSPATPAPNRGRLVTLNRLDPNQATNTRRFDLGMRRGQFTINGVSMDMQRIDQTIPKGAVEIWEVVNNTGMLHNFHVHGTHFEVLDRNGSAAAVAGHEQGFKDTVRLGANERLRLLISLDAYRTGAEAPYMFHCHILEHEDRGMMGQFIVV
jgi:FtsP/CotA-like multicopper oxidase with cupredoxin domain